METKITSENFVAAAIEVDAMIVADFGIVE